MSKIVLLTQGYSNPSDAKTAAGVLRWRGSEVVGILDSECAGRTAQEMLGVGGSIPILASLDGVDADTLLIGIAPAGGVLPPEWKDVLREAIRRGMDIVSGLHYFIGDDDEFRELARRRSTRIHDVRKPPRGLTVSTNTARDAACFRVHTVGHDCGVGKLVVSVEVDRALRGRGRRSALVATGQTGMMISGGGICVDAVVSDFIAGAIEAEVLKHSGEEFVLIEGQGSLVHPLYSGVTLGLLHGCAPQAMIMCIDPKRTEVRHCDMPMPPLDQIIDHYHRMAGIICPSRVVAIAVNTFAMSGEEADAAIRSVREMTGLPATDVIRCGPDEIVDAILAEKERRERHEADDAS
ncbi:MAG: DUF1611 domain-containing protein [Planctomycetes bacterium]|nr:DUF1611 domain-containing protein [Planctomycetota bacterium]